MLHCRVDQMKLDEIKLYHMGDSQHIQNIQINKIIGENEKCVLFYGKNHMDFLTNPVETKETFCWGCSCKGYHGISQE